MQMHRPYGLLDGQIKLFLAACAFNLAQQSSASRLARRRLFLTWRWAILYGNTRERCQTVHRKRCPAEGLASDVVAGRRLEVSSRDNRLAETMIAAALRLPYAYMRQNQVVMSSSTRPVNSTPGMDPCPTQHPAPRPKGSRTMRQSSPRDHVGMDAGVHMAHLMCGHVQTTTMVLKLGRVYGTVYKCAHCCNPSWKHQSRPSRRRFTTFNTTSVSFCITSYPRTPGPVRRGRREVALSVGPEEISETGRTRIHGAGSLSQQELQCVCGTDGRRGCRDKHGGALGTERN